jgi:xanthine dehydrogenase YagS FAD-binding subunit
MRPFTYERAGDLSEASRLGANTGQGQTDAPVQFLAGGTTLVDLMKLDVLRPTRVVDISPLGADLAGVALTSRGLHLGALATMSKVAEHPDVRRAYPAIAESLSLAASDQLRNMASLGGNVLQRTRCPYYRDPSWEACNKRRPGSGCTAIQGYNHNHAVLGVDENCIAQYPGDLGVVLAAFEAEVELSGPSGARLLAFTSLHRPADGEPHLETNLRLGEVITGFNVPAGAWTRRSLYLKVRDRSSYEFALASAAVGLDMDGETVRQARIGLGGVAYRPWRSPEAEAVLVGKPLDEATAKAATDAAFAGAVTHGGNDFKPELGRRTLVRALLQAQSLPVSEAS